MSKKVFLTGATGYIGGDALYALHHAHPDWQITCLVRSDSSAEKVKKVYPNVRTVIGDLDSADIIKKEAANADVVVHTADSSDHEGAAHAIAEGLIQGHTKERPGHWLHMGGAGILTFSDSKKERFGEPPEKEYDDWERVEELTNLPDDAFHRNVDLVVLKTGTEHSDKVKTAILCPPTIYGKGRGPGSGRSRQVYELTKITLQRQKAPVIGRGLSYWNNVHVHDLASLFCLLAQRAASHDTKAELWGAKGYYLAENGGHVWGELSKQIAELAAKKGYMSKPETEPMDKDEAWEVADFQALSWGLNSKGKARRAKECLGWKPSAPSLDEELPDIVESEWKLLQESKK